VPGIPGLIQGIIAKLALAPREDFPGHRQIAHPGQLEEAEILALPAKAVQIPEVALAGVQTENQANIYSPPGLDSSPAAAMKGSRRTAPCCVNA